MFWQYDHYVLPEYGGHTIGVYCNGVFHNYSETLWMKVSATDDAHMRTFICIVVFYAYPVI